VRYFPCIIAPQEIDFCVKGVLSLLIRIKLPKIWSAKRRQAPVPQSEELFCLQCNRKILPDAKFCPHCRAVILRKYCQSCKRLFPDHSLSCPYCGAHGTEKRKSHNFKHLINLAMILFLLGTLTLLWPKQKTDVPVVKKLSSVAVSPSVQKNPVQIKATSAPAVQISAPTDSSAGVKLNLKGHSLIQQGRYQEAIGFLQQSVDSFPAGSTKIEYFFAQYNLGHSLRRVGKSEEAIPYLERCVSYDRNNEKFVNELEAARRDVSRKQNDRHS
jgi:tetratricopeptide (TPR) repeat protein